MYLRPPRKYFSVLLIIILPFLIRTTKNNTCPSYFQYFLINFSDECYYNPDVDLGVPELINKYSGSLRQYQLTTEDGYILTMFRIFRENPKGVLLFQPPISAGSIAWLSDSNNSLPFRLWNMGYDVWLSNHRGASYSRRHVNLTTSDPEFWDYSFHEIAQLDFRVQFDLIRNETNARVTYIGYSMSATDGLVYASLYPEETETRIETLILIAPTSIMDHFGGPFKLLLHLMAPFKEYFQLGEFLTMEPVRWLGNLLTVAPLAVDISTSVIMGWTSGEMDPGLFPYVFAHHGRGITNKMLYHFQQVVESGRFAMYDHGMERNVEVYNDTQPPEYPLDRIRTPVYVISGEKDAVTAPLDVDALCGRLLNKEQLRKKIMIPNHNHIDYLFSTYRERKTYKAIFEILDEIY